MRSFGFLAVVAFLVPLVAHAGTPTPEIDPGSATSAIALVAGAVYVLMNRKSAR
jgi:hypothetical protein